MKRKLTWVLALAGLLTLASALLLWPPPDSITLPTWQKINLGNELEAVNQLLGSSGENRANFVDWLDNRTPFYDGNGNQSLAQEKEQPNIKYWYGRDGIIIIRFDQGGAVSDKLFLGMRQSEPVLWYRFRRWVGW
jgi:hypothetical protein